MSHSETLLDPAGFCIELLQTTFESNAAERAQRLARPAPRLKQLVKSWLPTDTHRRQGRKQRFDHRSGLCPFPGGANRAWDSFSGYAPDDERDWVRVL